MLPIICAVKPLRTSMQFWRTSWCDLRCYWCRAGLLSKSSYCCPTSSMWGLRLYSCRRWTLSHHYLTLLEDHWWIEKKVPWSGSTTEKLPAKICPWVVSRTNLACCHGAEMNTPILLTKCKMAVITKSCFCSRTLCRRMKFIWLVFSVPYHQSWLQALMC